LTLAAEDRVSALLALGVDFGALYHKHFHLLVGVGVDRFHIEEGDAKTLAQEIFLAYFLKAETVRDVRAWLIGAMFNASKQYMRKRSRDVALPPDIVNEPDPRLNRISDILPDQLAARQAFACVSARCQLALRLRYLEGYSIAEVAAELHTTPRYAQNLIARCLRQAHDRYGGKKEP
jgi:RNA polymerase sigma factor (sigma-70 family)